MNTKQSIALMAYAGLLIVLGILPQWIEPEIAERALVFGLVSGLLCQLWGVLGLFGFRRRICVALTLLPIILVFLSQAVTRWMPASGGKPTSLLLTVLITLMLGATMGLFVWIMPHEQYGPPSAVGGQKKQDAAGSTRKST
jgi:hypothetical protein